MPGSFAYSPATGTVLHAGSGQALSATFTPADSTDYTTASAGVKINVTRAPLTVTANDQGMAYGGSLPSFTVGYAGFVNGDDATTLGGALSCSTTATSASPVGSYPISCSGQTSSDYTITYVNGTLTITKANQTISLRWDSGGRSWPLPISMTSGGGCSPSAVTVPERAPVSRSISGPTGCGGADRAGGCCGYAG